MFFFFLFYSLESAAQIHTHSHKLEKEICLFLNDLKVRFVAAILAGMTAGSREA